MITVLKGNAKNSETFRLILICDQCQAHVETEVPLHNMYGQGNMATELYLERARGRLALVCPHMQEELRQQATEAQPASQEEWSTPQRRPSSYNGHF